MIEPDEQLVFLQDEVAKVDQELIKIQAKRSEAQRRVNWHKDYLTTRAKLEDAARHLIDLEQDVDDIARWAETAATDYEEIGNVIGFNMDDAG